MPSKKQKEQAKFVTLVSPAEVASVCLWFILNFIKICSLVYITLAELVDFQIKTRAITLTCKA